MGSCLFDLVLLMEADRWMPCKPVGVRLYTRAGTTSSSPAAKQIAPACRGVWAICFLWATRWVSASRRVQAAGRWRSRPLVLLHRNHELPVVSRWPWLSRQGLGACALPRGAAQVDPTPHDRSIWVRAVNASRTFQVSPLVSVRRVCVTIDISPDSVDVGVRTYCTCGWRLVLVRKICRPFFLDAKLPVKSGKINCLDSVSGF
jgi:hypothetical protein